MADSPRIEELRRRVQTDPASIAFAALAEEYRRAGRYAEAIDTCRTGLVRHPSYLSAHVTLGRALLEVGQFDEAQEELEFVLRLAPENLAAIRGLAEIHQRRAAQSAQAPAMATAVQKAVPVPFQPLEITPAVVPPVPIPVPSAAANLSRDIATNEAPQDSRTAPTAPPALARLEEFLSAIERARAQRHAGSR